MGKNKFSSEEIAIKIAGSKWALSTSIDAIKSWSPNLIKGFVIGYDEDGVFIDTFFHLGVNNSFRTYIPFEYKSKLLPAFNLLFGRRKYSCLEFFCWQEGIEDEIEVFPALLMEKLKPLAMLVEVGSFSEMYENRDAVDSGYFSERGCEVFEIDERFRGLGFVTFQPATYQIDTEIEAYLTEKVEKGNLVTRIEEELSGESFERMVDLCKIFRVVFSNTDNKFLDFQKVFQEAGREVIKNHQFSVSDEDFKKALKASPHITDKLEEIDYLWQMWQKRNKEKYRFSANSTIFRLEEFVVNWYKAIRDGLTKVLGNGFISKYEKTIESTDSIDRLWGILNIQSNFESGSVDLRRL